MPRPIIFDFDGTIVDSEPLANQGLAHTLTELGFSTTYDEAVRTYIGLRLTDCIRKAESVHGRKLPDTFAELCRARIRGLIDAHLQPVPGAMAFVRERALHPIAIASSSRVVSIEHGLARVGLAGIFDRRIYSAADIERGLSELAAGEPLIYGLLAVVLSALAGFAAYIAFRERG